MRIYKEKTSDNGYCMTCAAVDNNADYLLTSATAHDLYNEYTRKYQRLPSASWYNRHFSFQRIK